MKKINFIFAIIFLTFSFLFVVKNNSLAVTCFGTTCAANEICGFYGCALAHGRCNNDSDCGTGGQCDGHGRCIDPSERCGGPNDCGPGETCTDNGRCVPRVEEPTAPPVVPPTATPIPTTTPIPPTATPAPACSKKSQGDADCDGSVTLKDYFYYVAKKAGATLPTTVNVDFNGSGTVDAADRAIVVKTLKP